MCWTLSYLSFFQTDFGFFQSEFGFFQLELGFLKLWTRVRTLFWTLSYFGFFQFELAFLSFQNPVDLNKSRHKWTHQWLLRPKKSQDLCRVINPRYYKYWLYTLAATIDCSCLVYFDQKKSSLKAKINQLFSKETLILYLFCQWKDEKSPLKVRYF